METEPSVKKEGAPTLEESVLTVVATLPKPIQDFLTGPERDAVTIKIATKYNLHTDQAGEFQRAFLFMLMGISSPEQFVSELQSAGIDSETVKSLANDVNEEVFKPLREKERSGNVEKPLVVTSVPAQPVVASRPIQAPVSTTERIPAPYAGGRPQPLTPFNLPGADAHPNDLFRSATRSVAPVPIQPPPPATTAPITPTPPVPIAAPVPQAPKLTPPPAQMPVEKVFTPEPPARTAREGALGGTLRTMATDMLAVNEHREPEPVQYKGTVFTPPVIMEKIPVLLPVTPKPPTVTNVPSAPSIQPMSRPTVTSSPSSELIKEYSSDPYREPV